jgi:hypothetical protein
MENVIVDNTRVMAKGQITLPKDIRTRLVSILVTESPLLNRMNR